MKQGRNYTSIWKVEKVVHAIAGWELPGPVRFRFLLTAGVTFMVMLIAQVLIFIPADMGGAFLTKFLVLPLGMGFLSLAKWGGRPIHRHVQAMAKHTRSAKVSSRFQAVEVDEKRNVK